MLVDVAIINEKDIVPPGFTVIDQTSDSSEFWKAGGGVIIFTLICKQSVSGIQIPHDNVQGCILI